MGNVEIFVFKLCLKKYYIMCEFLKINLYRKMCDFVRKKQNNMNKCRILKSHTNITYITHIQVCIF